MVDSAGRQALPLALHTPLLDLLGCEVPVMNAGMGGVARHELAAAVGDVQQRRRRVALGRVPVSN